MGETATKETFSFQAEVGRLLDIVAGSLYSNREIFLRELISNASDACDRLRYNAISAPSLIDGDPEFRIDLSVDKKAGTIAIADNGIGMGHDDLLETLGTIAKSGTGAFLDQVTKDAGNELNLIGQFGVGFYSAFMVADRVDAVTRKAGEAEAWLWSSDGKGAFSIEPAQRDERGTTVTLHIKKDAKEFLEESRVRHIVKNYSDHIGFPVRLGGETINSASAIWTRLPKEVSAEQYKEFYHHIAHAFDEPWLTIHNRVEGVVSYTNLLFIPSAPPIDLFEPERQGHVKLYVNRVFITEDTTGLLPPFLRFLRGVVDSEDLPLNISREMLQTEPRLTRIKSGLTKRVLSELKKKATRNPEEYAGFWNDFGAVLKEGLVDDHELKDKILEVCRFASTAGEGLAGLSDYVESMKENQEAIYYIAGDDLAKISVSPHLEGYRARGVEVLLLSDSVDEFWVQRVGEFDGKPFKSVTRGAADLDGIKGVDGTKQEVEDQLPALNTLIALIKLELGDVVKDVRPSRRLTVSPACLIADEGDLDVNIERLLRRHGQLKDTVPRILEINPNHPIIKKLSEKTDAEGAAENRVLRDSAHLLLDQARIIEGEAPSDPAEFARRLNSVMESALRSREPDQKV